jgi:cobalt-zinc-cadmium efflux system outer membrane protein
MDHVRVVTADVRRRCASAFVPLAACAAICAACGHGCGRDRHSPHEARRDLAAALSDRTGLDVRLPAPDSPSRHPAAAFPGPLTEQQAVETALRHNAWFQEQLADLGLSWADVVQAGQLTNPDLQVLFPLGPKQAEATLTVPLEFLLFRGRRVESARAASDRAVERLVQAGLDLVRDVRLAHADLALARRRRALMSEAADLRRRAAGLAAARVRAGDAAPLDEVTARAEVARARQDAARAGHDASIAEERLRALLGLGMNRDPIRLAGEAPAGEPFDGGGWVDTDADVLVARAVSDRPDARAAESGVAAARQRAKLARAEWFTFSAVADYNQRGSDGAEAGPGLKMALPVFNLNRANVARADAELERSVRQGEALRHRIILEVRESHAHAVQARQDLRDCRAELLPALREAVTLSERAYRAGETPFVQVLDANRQLLEGQVREAQVESDLRRARAELERAVGRRLDVAPRPGDDGQGTMR